ncbi:MAG: hypothetical protein ACYTGZ_00050 [Planctomycetota bacterium]|jgi:hypothetical protein
MRVVLVALALAIPASGAPLEGPSIRWLDATGDAHRAAVKKTISESDTAIEVELKDPGKGKPATLKLKVADLLEFIREDRKVAEQRRLLDARTAVAAGLDLKNAAAALDSLAQEGSAAWIREYAAAFRAIAARRVGDKNAAQRIQAFLRAHPKSRFVFAVIHERAWIRSLALGGTKKSLEAFREGFEKIGAREGQLRVQYACLRDTAVRNTQVFAGEAVNMKGAMRGVLIEMRPKPSLAEITVRFSSGADWTIAEIGEFWRKAHAAKLPIGNYRDRLLTIEEGADLLLPGTRADLQLELGAIALAAGKKDEAKARFEQAKKEPAGAVHAYRAAHYLRELERTVEKR